MSINMSKSPNSHFFDEVQKEGMLAKLYPERSVFLAIVWLYDKILDGTFKDKTFYESDIHKALDKTNPSFQKKNLQRQPKEVNNATIAELQEFYLRRDEERQVYMLKDFAIEICRKAHMVLMANINPSLVEKICAELKDKLDKAENDSTVEEWLNLHFDAFRPKIKEQIDYLDRQVDHSVLQLRINIAKQSTEIIEKLKIIDAELETLQEKSRQLRRSLYQIDYIREKLTSFSVKTEISTLADQAYLAASFFQEIKYQLTVVDQRIDRIRPKIKQLFGNLNMPVFNTKMELFIRHLIEKSEVVTVNSSKQIQLPVDVPMKQVKWLRCRFTIVERKIDIFPMKPIARREYIQTEEKVISFTKTAIDKLQTRTRLQEMLDEIEKMLRDKGEFDTSEYFYNTLDKFEGNVDLAVKILHQIIKKYSKDASTTIEIQKTLQSNTKYEDIALWKMKITTK
jgi:hypothetical protein